jgi:hypothetical protein
MLVLCVENPMAPILVYGCVTLLTGILSLHISPETRKENQLDSFLFISVFPFLLIYFFVRPGIVLWIRIRSDLNLSAGSGSGKIHSDPSSSKSEMNLK